MCTRSDHFFPIKRIRVNALDRIPYVFFIPVCFHISPLWGREGREGGNIIDGGFFRHPVERMAGLTQESYLFPVGPEPRRQSYGINTLTYSFSKLLPFQFVPLSSSLYGRAAFRIFVRDIFSSIIVRGDCAKTE